MVFANLLDIADRIPSNKQNSFTRQENKLCLHFYI